MCISYTKHIYQMCIYTYQKYILPICLCILYNHPFRMQAPRETGLLVFLWIAVFIAPRMIHSTW